LKNLFQNKFMVVLIVISILLVGTTSFISALGYTSYVRNAIGVVLTPIQEGANFVFDGIEDIFTSDEDYKRLEKENKELKEKLAKQEEELAKAQLALEENRQLKEYFGIKEEHTDCTFENATVTGRQSNTYNTVLTVNKGSYHGIKPGMPVIDNLGVIGCISEVGLTWSKVTLLTEPDFSIGVSVEKNSETGICSGSFAASKNGLCILTHLPDETEVSVGDRIVTSDSSTLFPKGLTVGKVEAIDYDTVSREKICYIKPSADLKNADSVMIITDFKDIYE